MSLTDPFRSLFLYFFLGHTHLEKDSFQYYRFPESQSNKIERDELPPRPHNHLRIIVVSDTHNRHDRLGHFPKCDLFVHCGDILMTGKKFSHKYQLSVLQHFDEWISKIPAEKKIVIAGNHDDILVNFSKEERKQVFNHAQYLENESLVWKGAHIWASPISVGKSPNKAFQSKDFEEDVLVNLPVTNNVDILITHGINDRVSGTINHKLHLFGHNHNSYGVYIDHQEDPMTGEKKVHKVAVCAPICDGGYRLKQLPVIIDYPLDPHRLPSRNNSLIHDQKNDSPGTINNNRTTPSGTWLQWLVGMTRSDAKVVPIKTPSEDEN